MGLYTALMIAGTERPVDGVKGVFISSGVAVISSAMTMVGATISAGESQYVYSRGKADATLVSGGVAYISLGGVANSAIVEAAGSMYILSGGVANSLTTHGSGVRVYVSRGGTAQNVNINSGGAMTISANGYCSGAQIYTGGSADVYGMLTDAVTQETATYIFVYPGGVLSDSFIPLGNVIVSSGGTAEDVVFSGFGVASRGTFNLRQGGSANRITAQRAENIYTNGNITNLTIDGNGAVAYLRSPAVASGVVLGSGTLVIQTGASALAVEMINPATCLCQSSGYCSGVIMSGRVFSAYTDCLVHDLVLQGGTALFATGALGSGIVVSSGASMNVDTGASAFAVTSHEGAIITGEGYIEYVNSSI